MRYVTLLGGLAALCLLIAAPAQATHPRPAGAAPMRMSLVPAYAACATPNRTHGAPLAFPSCNPPTQMSGQATVGTPDAFGGPVNFLGSLKFETIVGVPGPPDDTDVRLRWNLTDVRCEPTGARCGGANAAGPADYSGQLGFSFRIRSTDHWNAVAPGGGTDPATIEDVILSAGFTCAQTASTSTGSTCKSFTSYNAFFPGLAKDTKRVVQETDDVHIYDGGNDGVASTTADNTVFLRQGIFVP
jgi:hypothetical protein